MSDFLVAFIRTAVPAAVGAVLAWLASIGLDLGATAEVPLISALTLSLTLLYYAGARALEGRFPALGVLLGVPKAPVYKTASPAADETGLVFASE